MAAKIMGLKRSPNPATRRNSDQSDTLDLSRGKSVVLGSLHNSERKRVEQERNSRNSQSSLCSQCIILPWNTYYRIWWGWTVFCAILTVFTETYAIAFVPAGYYSLPNGVVDGSFVVEIVLVSVFALDMALQFFVGFYDDQSEGIVLDPTKIALHYLQGKFWVDFVGIFPFYAVILAMADMIGQDTPTTQYLSLLRLLKLVRLHRVAELFRILQYTQRVSLTLLTIARNFVFALVWSHIAACAFYFIARQYGFREEETWIGSVVGDLSRGGAYTTSLYWSIVTFTTVGYGDYSPVNTAEQIWSMIYMLLNIICQAWIIGSITLLVVKEDEKTGEYREALATLKHYSEVNHLPTKMKKSLKAQLKLAFNNREISDENVLGQFPANTRRKVLRRLYLPCVMQTRLMRGVRQQFVDAFLSSSRVEIFGPGEEILRRGSLASDLYLLVYGVAKAGVLLSGGNGGGSNSNTTAEEAWNRQNSFGGTSIADSERAANGKSKDVEMGEFLNEVGFFTESPQVDTVVTQTVCKTLTLSREAYKAIAEDHPGSIGLVLHNLKEKAEEMVEEAGFVETIRLPTSLASLRVGSVYSVKPSSSSNKVGNVGKVGNGGNVGNHHRRNDDTEDLEFQRAMEAAHAESALTTVVDLITTHMNKQRDDHTTRFLFAASRGDISTIQIMLKQGFDPNQADYDSRTALMVSAMKGNGDTVKLLLDYEANPNLVDMHGTSALYEAARNGHDATMDILLQHGAKLCLDGGEAASKLCQLVFDGDMVTMRRLLQAGIPVDAEDYDKRTAGHIAAAEGNTAALKLLVEFGSDLFLKDRWGNTAEDEARRVDSSDLLEFIASVKSGEYHPVITAIEE